MKKLWTMIKGCPLFSGIIATALLLTAASYGGAAAGIYNPDVSFAHPMLESVLLNKRVATDTDADSAAGDGERATESDTAMTVNTASGGDDQGKDNMPNGDAASEDSTQEQITTQQIAIDSGGGTAPAKRTTKYRQVETRKARNACYDDLTQIALETDYPYIKVDKSYFDDALFIGDSRIEGLQLYSNLDNAQFACMEGLTAFGLMTEKVAENGTKTLTELLENNTYSKIYIMLGINEAGYATDSYVSTYMDNIARIRELQPQAVIFMMGCMHVTTEYSDAHDVMNNDNIDQKNSAIAAYADGVKLFYLDMNTVVDDSSGGLTKDYTWDDVHLQAQYYSLWEEYLYERGLKEEMFK